MRIDSPYLTPEVLALLARAVFPGPDAAARLTAFYAPEQGRLCFGWQREGQVVSALGLQQAGPHGQITHIGTGLQWSGQGYARALILSVAGHLRLRTVTAETDDDAVDFYRKCGFVVSETRARGGRRRYHCVLPCPEWASGHGTIEPMPLPPEFFQRDPVRVARELLGATLVRTLPGGERLSGKVVETEAYDCPRDPACTAGRFHAARSAEMSIPAGHWLFWTAHGHPLLQVACREEGISASVLIRALEPLEGLPFMLDFRPVTRERDLTNGPAKLVYALGLNPTQVSHTRVDSPALHLLPGPPIPEEAVGVTARVGIREGRHLPWRFTLRGNPWVSPAAPSMEL